jgi:hypothetical protein
MIHELIKKLFICESQNFTEQTALLERDYQAASFISPSRRFLPV